MANVASNAVVGKPKVSGGLLVAPIGTALPTNESTAPNAAFKSVGYVTEDGVTRAESRDTDRIRAWGGDTIAVVFTNTEVTAQFGLAEYLNPLTQQMIYGTANISTTAPTVSAGSKLAITGKLIDPPKNAIIVEMFSGKATGRLVFPIAQVSETEDVTYKDDELAARGVTVTLYSDTSGNYFYEYWDDGVTL
jgi:hypothetical protein